MINQSTESTPVILYSGLIEADRWHDSENEAEREYCEFPLRGMYPLPAQRTVIPLPTSTTSSLNESKRRLLPGSAWLLVRGDAQTADRIQHSMQVILGGEWQVAESHDYGRTHLRLLTERQDAGDP